MKRLISRLQLPCGYFRGGRCGQEYGGQQGCAYGRCVFLMVFIFESLTGSVSFQYITSFLFTGAFAGGCGL